MRDVDETDFDRLVELHYDPLYRFAMSMTRNQADAYDLVQDTFATWAAKGHQLRDSVKAKGWLFTTLYRRFLELHRYSARFPHLEIVPVHMELPSVEAESPDRLDGSTVLTLLAHIDPHHQAAVALFYLEDYSYKEIAGILEVPVGTVKSRIARGLAQLKRLMLQASETLAKARNCPGK